MNKHAIISIILIALFIVIPIVAHAAIFVSPTKSFGGRVLLTSNPSVTCNPLGTGPLLISGVSSALPYYAIRSFTGISTTTPRTGSWILGRVSVTPESYNCYIPAADNIPFPVFDTSYFGVSR